MYGYVQLFRTCWFYKIKRKRTMKMKICQRDGMDLLCTAEFWAMFRFPFKMRCTNFKINLMIHKLSFAKGRVWMLLYTSFCLKSLFETLTSDTSTSVSDSSAPNTQKIKIGELKSAPVVQITPVTF